MASIAILLLLPVVFLTVYLLQQPQTIQQYALDANPGDPTAPGPVCDANTVLPPDQREILKEICAVDYATDLCKDMCKRTETPEAECAPGGRFGPPPPPPPPPVAEQPGAGGGGGSGGSTGGCPTAGQIRNSRGVCYTPVRNVKSPGRTSNSSGCKVNSQCASGFCNLSSSPSPRCGPTQQSRIGERNLDFCTLNPNHASCGGRCGNGKEYVPGGRPGFGYCKK